MLLALGVASAGIAVALVLRYDRIMVSGSSAWAPQQIGYIDRWSGRVCLIRGAWLRCYCTKPGGLAPEGSGARAVARVGAVAESTSSAPPSKTDSATLFADFEQYEATERQRGAGEAAEEAAAAATCR